MYWEDDWGCNDAPKKMSSKKKHQFAITCRYCGGNDVTVTPYEYGDLGIKCNSCGESVSCGTYYTQSGDYSDMTI